MTKNLKRTKDLLPWAWLFLQTSHLSLTPPSHPKPHHYHSYPQGTGERKFLLTYTCTSLFIVSWEQLLSLIGGVSIYFRNHHFSLIYDLFQGPEFV
jgi:hypothetical protein